MKYETLINYASSNGLLKSNDIITDDSIQNARVFLRNRTSEELLDLVYNYNQQENVEPIELELDKDYRDKKAFCDLNEVIEYYDELFNNSKKLKKYFEE
jgi:hypothetical protein